MFFFLMRLLYIVRVYDVNVLCLSSKKTDVLVHFSFRERGQWVVCRCAFFEKQLGPAVPLALQVVEAPFLQSPGHRDVFFSRRGRPGCWRVDGHWTWR